MSQIIWSPGMTLEAVERQVIQKAIQFYHDNRQLTAASLGISPPTLNARILKYEAEDSAAKHVQDRQRRKEAHHLARARGQTVAAFEDTDSGSEADAWLYEESAAEDSEESKMSMSERPKVQSVLHKQAANVRAGNRRG